MKERHVLITKAQDLTYYNEVTFLPEKIVLMKTERLTDDFYIHGFFLSYFYMWNNEVN